MNKYLLKNKKGSSETIREAFDFNFSKYIKNKPEHIKNVNESFLEWFIGFTEGDGSFIISNKRCYFVINQKDIKILYKIKANLGFGHVFKYIQNNKIYGRYVVQDKKNCRRLAHIFNGNLVLNKTNERFKIWIKELNIIILTTKGVINLENSWLSGFIDAEGGFYASLTKQNNLILKYRLRLKFYITQKNEYELLKLITRLLYFKQKNIKKSNLFNPDKYISKYSNNIYRLEISTSSLIVVILDYLTKYKLKSEKIITFFRWKRIYLNKDILKNLAVKSKKSLTRFKKLVKSVNNKK